MSTERWTPADLPDLTGHVALVTGANAGLGLHTSLELARAGAHVVMGARDPLRGDEALGQVRVRTSSRPGGPQDGGARPAPVELYRLDLADLASVRAAADRFLVEQGRLDILVNNAGVMAVPRALTADGFELQLGTNHLGHFALTGLLMPALLRGSVLSGPARVVTVTSMMHRMGRLHRDDLMGERHYGAWTAYGQSKLANLLFTLELQRRVAAPGLPVASLAAHPGYANTNLAHVAARQAGRDLTDRLIGWGNRLLAQPAEQGAWPSLRAAGDPAALGGQFYGPDGLFERRGHPRLVTPARHALHPGDADWLWNRSSELTGVTYQLVPS